MDKWLITAFLYLLTACATPRVVQDVQRDSVALIVRDSVILRDSVIYVRVPYESASSVLMDTDTSVLKTNLAESVAYVDKGKLHHTLRNRGGAEIPISIRLPEHIHYEEKGLVRYVDKIEYVEVEKELNGWQRLLQTLGWIVMLGGLLWIIRKVASFVS